MVTAPRPIRATAYLMVRLRAPQPGQLPLPVIDKVAIMSSSAPSDGLWATIFHADGDDFQKARDAVVAMCEHASALKWCVPWLRRMTPEEHMACIDVGQIIDDYVDGVRGYSALMAKKMPPHFLTPAKD